MLREWAVQSRGKTTDLQKLQETHEFLLSEVPPGCFFMFADLIYLKSAYQDSEDGDGMLLCFAIATGKALQYEGNPLVLLITGTISIGACITEIDN